MTITRRSFVALAGITALTLGGCSGSGQPNGSNEVNEPAVAEVEQEAEPKDLEVAETGFYFDSYGTAHFASIVSNPNSTWAAENIQVTVAARDVLSLIHI